LDFWPILPVLALGFALSLILIYVINKSSRSGWTNPVSLAGGSSSWRA